jgi:hypothetical protein
MNLLTTSSRDFLPKEKRSLIEQKEKVFMYRKRFGVFLLSTMVIVIALIIFPQIVRKTVQPIYGQGKQDPIITDTYSVKTVTGIQLADALHLNNIVSPQIAAEPQLAELTVKPTVNEKSVSTADNDVIILHNYLVANGSPAAGSAATFINVAQEYGFNWKLLVGIADTESGLCKVIPIMPDGRLSYNCFGFGVYGDNVLAFKSFDDAIETVGKSLAQTYGVKNLTPLAMEPSYCPPATYNHSWADSVQTVMDEL